MAALFVVIEVSSSANVDVDDYGRCSHRYRYEGLGVCFRGKSYRTGSEAATVKDQWRRVQFVLDSVCGSKEVIERKCRCQRLWTMRPLIRRQRYRDVLWREELLDWLRGDGGGGAKEESPSRHQQRLQRRSGDREAAPPLQTLLMMTWTLFLFSTATTAP